MALRTALHLLSAAAGSYGLSISVASTGGVPVNPLQYGIMFEDINHSGDGGIYAELLQNRAFQGSPYYPSDTSFWNASEGVTLSLQNLTDPLSVALPTSLNVAVQDGAASPAQVSNYGFWGIPVKVQDYTGSFHVKGDYSGTFTVELKSYLTNTSYGSVGVESKAIGDEWVQHSFVLTPEVDAPNVNNTFTISFDPSGLTGGSLNFNLFSLFPPTYKDRPNGNRIDLMETLEELKPSFLRFPGGNNLEGQHAPYYWKWNETIGPLTERPGRPGTWNYQNTDGLGLIEYMNWCDDLGMEPILGVWAGLYLDGTIIPADALQEYVTDALNELEFLTGAADSPYGAKRAALGYPDPWTINYVEVGNEDMLSNGLVSYQDYRFPSFYNAIKAAYPHINIIASHTALALPDEALGDYHEYTRPDIFAGRFDFFDGNTSTHKTFNGEYAVVQYNRPQGGGVDWNAPRPVFPWWIGTVAEAVFLLGAEKNADKILGSGYAPLFQNLDSYQWSPDLISYTADPGQTVRSTSWHLVKLLSGTRATTVLPTVSEEGTYGPVYWVAGVNEDRGTRVFKAAVYNSTTVESETVVNDDGTVPVAISFEGVEEGAAGTLTVLTAPDGYSFNDIGKDLVQTDVTEVKAGKDGVVEIVLPDLSVAVLEVKG